jgi:hypothetical protein
MVKMLRLAPGLPIRIIAYSAIFVVFLRQLDDFVRQSTQWLAKCTGPTTGDPRGG